MFDLIIYVPVNICSAMWEPVFLCWNNIKQRIKCLTQGLNDAKPQPLDHTRVKHCTTEPPRSSYFTTCNTLIMPI